jgi:DNA-binding response OmpR family regulator
MAADGLVVEDDNDTLAAFQIYLEQLEHIVFSARNKAEVLKIPRANCHVLISDINLPDGNGWEILEEIVKPVFPDRLDTLLKEATAELTEKE